MGTGKIRAGWPSADASHRSRRWWLLLAVVLVWCAAGQTLSIWYAWQHNPFARVPIMDAEVYWRWAADIAGGKLLAPTPFMSAPLYPYLLGVVRALEGELWVVYLLQAALHLLTVALLALGAARRFGPPAGLLAAALFALSAEPAFFAGRVLNCAPQLLAGVALWGALVRASQRGTLGAWALAGVALGVNCLLNPPLLLGTAFLSLWAWWQGGWSRGGLLRACVLAGAAALTISPATLHNYLVSREIIPISGQAGITFAQGNTPDGDGTYRPIAGVSDSREQQNLDALRLYRQATGETGGWNAANRYFFRRGLNYWLSQPAEAVALIFRKVWWFLTGRYVGDIYLPQVEQDLGLAGWRWLAPLPLAWLIPPALVGLVALAREPRRYGVELVLFGVPLLVVAVFFYSPRYRLPATPMIVVAAGWVLSRAVRRGASRAWLATASAALLTGIGLGYVNRATNFDRVEPYLGNFYYSLGYAHWNAGQLERAAEAYRQSLSRRPDFAPAARDLGSALMLLGKRDEALAALRQAVQIDPGFVLARRQLAQMLLAAGQLDEARQHLQAAEQAAPADAGVQAELGVLFLAHGEAAAARERFQRALQIDPTYAPAHEHLGTLLHEQRQYEQALRHLREAVRLDPKRAVAKAQIGEILLARGDAAGGLAALRAAHQLAPQHPGIANNLAWRLATLPDLGAAERAEALALAILPDQDADPTALSRLDTRAAALAASGRFAEAVELTERALRLAEKHADAEMVASLRQRRELYQAGKAYVEPAGPMTP